MDGVAEASEHIQTIGHEMYDTEIKSTNSKTQTTPQMVPLENQQGSDDCSIFSFVASDKAYVDLKTNGSKTRISLGIHPDKCGVTLIYPRGWAVTFSERGGK